MNLISCSCGIVLDKDKLHFPCVYDPDTAEPIIGASYWNGNEWVAKVSCPVCGSDVLEKE